MKRSRIKLGRESRFISRLSPLQIHSGSGPVEDVVQPFLFLEATCTRPEAGTVMSSSIDPVERGDKDLVSPNGEKISPCMEIISDHSMIDY